jgi:hypothetical protein
VSPSPCGLAAFVMMSNEALSKGLSISRKATSVTSLYMSKYCNCYCHKTKLPEGSLHQKLRTCLETCTLSIVTTTMHRA